LKDKHYVEIPAFINGSQVPVKGDFMKNNTAFSSGFSQEEAGEKRPHEKHYSESEIYKKIESIMGEDYQNFEFRAFNKDHTGGVFLNIRKVLNEAGETLYYEGFIEDLKEKRYKEELRIEKEILEGVHRAIKTFLANMSHEIRTPMNAIIGFAELLSDRVKEDRERDYLNSIVSSSRTLLALINDILALSRFEAGKMEIQNRPVSIFALFNDIKQIFSIEAEKKGLNFLLHIDSSLPPLLYLDEVCLRQILFNLAGNAVRFTSKGYVKLSAFKRETFEDGSIEFALSVEDTGPGIPDEEKNFLLGQERTKYRGTGLGFSVIKRLAEMMKGEINLETQSGKGSNLLISFKRVFTADLNDTLPVWDREKVKAENKSDSTCFISPESRDKLPELINILENEVREKWNRVCKSFVITGIKDFALEIKRLGEEYEVYILKEWGEKIFKEVEIFDLENLPATLEEFPDLVEKISKL